VLLTVDIGNTNIVLGLFDGNRAADVKQGDNAALLHDWRMRTDARMTADEMALTVRGLLGSYSSKITGIAALSTVPALLRELKVMVDRYWPQLPRVIVERCSTTTHASWVLIGSSTRWPPTPSTAARRSWWTSAPPPTST
jgi:type III pantothenate kinase